MNELAEKKRTLIDIVEDIISTAWQVDQADGVLDDDLESELDALAVELPEKVDRVLYAVEGLQAKADTYANRAKNLGAAAKRIKKDATRLAGYCKMCIEATGQTKLETEHYPSVTVRRNPPRVEIDNEELFIVDNMDSAFVKTTTTHKADKTAIKSALKGGDDVSGAGLVQTTSLRF